MTCGYYAKCHNLKPLKIDDEDPPSIFKTKFLNIFHLPHIIMYVADCYDNIQMAFNSIQMVKYFVDH